MRYLFLLLLLTSCAHGDDLVNVLGQPVDTTMQRQFARQLSTGRIKFKGPVTFQIAGTGSTLTNTAIAKAKAPVAAAPHSAATEQKPGTPWQVYALVGAIGLGVGIWLSSKLGWLGKLL